MHFPERKCIDITIKNSLKFIPNGPISNILTLVQIMAWRRPGHGWLTDVGHNSWWHMKMRNMQGIIPYPERCDYSDIPGGGHE